MDGHFGPLTGQASASAKKNHLARVVGRERPTPLIGSCLRRVMLHVDDQSPEQWPQYVALWSKVMGQEDHSFVAPLRTDHVCGCGVASSDLSHSVPGIPDAIARQEALLLARLSSRQQGG